MSAFLLLVAWVLVRGGEARGVEISGRDYVRMSEWAGANGLEMRWLRRDETIQLSNHSSRLVFTVDSSEAQVNGVQVRLLFPLALHSGLAYLSRLDAQTTLHPILVPPRNQAGAVIKTICLDPGHGGRDPGYQVGPHQEKQYNLLLAQEVSRQLAHAGLKVSLTRTRDTFVDLSARPETARRRKADLFVSLHFNASETSRNSVQGVEVYCLTPAGAPSSNARGEGAGSGAYAGNKWNEKNMFLAYQLQKSLTQYLSAEDRGVHRARYAVLRDATMPAILIEGGFMSHPEEGRKIFDPGYRLRMARAIADGVLAYKRVVEQAG
jgi:N-acetylmuramoyl-L-alanine amidase